MPERHFGDIFQTAQPPFRIAALQVLIKRGISRFDCMTSRR